MSLSLILKRAFCSWICPFGTLSEGLALLGQKLFKRNFVPPHWLDNVLRSLKYLLLGFFVIFIFVLMDGNAAYSFLQTPYNMIADIKMLRFFQEISWVGITVLLAILFLSVLIQNFWCRYLCPYGALMGILSLISPWKIRRNETTCISCGKCTAACPNQLKVDRTLIVRSLECSGCLNCVEQCPVSDTLKFDLPNSKPSVAMSQRTLAIAVVVFWLAIIGIAKVTGYWESSIAPEMFKMLIPVADKL
jgi:polyferredoxin